METSYKKYFVITILNWLFFSFVISPVAGWPVDLIVNFGATIIFIGFNAILEKYWLSLWS